MIHRVLVGVVAALAVAVTIAMLLLAGGRVAADESAGTLPLENATLVEVRPIPADPGEGLQPPAVEVLITARLEAGGDVVELLPVVDETGSTFAAGQRVRVVPLVGDDGTYSIYDFRRETPLAVLAIGFCLVVVAFGRFQGLRALIGLALTALVVVAFLIPAILAGREPVVVALTAAFAIMLLTLYLSHGVNPKTTAAVIGTTLALLLTAGLSLLFVELAHLTGWADEDAVMANLGSGLSLRGLLLAGIVIGGLGVLDDVTVSQSSLVFELAHADRRAGFRTLVRRALRVGRDHVAASVNTLFLAYAGAFLPLLILFTTGVDPIGTVLTSEVVATEIVRTLVGSIGLIAAVPLTTALAAALVLSEREAPLSVAGRQPARAQRERGRHEPPAPTPATIPGALALEPGWSPLQEGAGSRAERSQAEPLARRPRARPRHPAGAGTPPAAPAPPAAPVSPASPRAPAPASPPPLGQPVPLARAARSGTAAAEQPATLARAARPTAGARDQFPPPVRGVGAGAGDEPGRRRSQQRPDRTPRQDRPRLEVPPAAEPPVEDVSSGSSARLRPPIEAQPLASRRRPPPAADLPPGDLIPSARSAPPPRRVARTEAPVPAPVPAPRAPRPDRDAMQVGGSGEVLAPRIDQQPEPSPRERRPAERALVEPRPGERPTPTERIPLTRRSTPAPPDELAARAPSDPPPSDPPPMVGGTATGRRRARPGPDAAPEVVRQDEPARRTEHVQPPAETAEPATRRTRVKGDGAPKRGDTGKTRRPRPRTALDAEQEQLEAWLKQMRNPYGRAEEHGAE